MEEKTKYSHTPKGRGRVKLNEFELRKKEIKVRLNEIEEDLIRQKAIIAGLSFAEFVRKSALDATIQERITPEQSRLIRLCSNVSNNLNQLAKSVHKEGVLAYATKIEAMIKYMEDKLYNNE